MFLNIFFKRVFPVYDQRIYKLNKRMIDDIFLLKFILGTRQIIIIARNLRVLNGPKTHVPIEVKFTIAQTALVCSRTLVRGAHDGCARPCVPPCVRDIELRNASA